MGKKRHLEESDQEIRQQIKKLQNKLEERNKRKRIRIIDSDSDSDEDAVRSEESSDSDVSQRSHSSERQKSNQRGPVAGPSSTEDVPDKSFDDDLLCLLGDAPSPETKLGEKIHEAIANRWQEILRKGLAKEAKEELLKQYLVPANCDLLVPPALNPEVKAALSEAMVKRDFGILEKQKQVGIALAALSRATELVASRETSAEKILKPLSDACRLLCDTLFMETKTRRNFVISSVSSDMKDTLSESPRTNLLFGDNVSDKVKSAKNIQRSGETLKGQQKSKFNKNNFINKDNSNNKNKLNSRPLHPRGAGRSDAGRGRSSLGRGGSQRAPPRRHRSAAERSPSPRRAPPRRQANRRY